VSVSFDVAADRYHRFMGRYSEPLGVLFADAAGVRAPQRALDVGCGPGALTAELVARLGAANVAAIDPSGPFVDAARSRFPEVDVRQGSAEQLGFEDGSFDVTLAELVVHFMADPVLGLREMGRVTRPGGTVAACVWDFGGEAGPLSLFWKAVADLTPEVENESGYAGARQGQLVELCGRAGLSDPVETSLSVTVPYASIEEWWEPYTFGIGPAGDHVQRLDDDGRERLRARCVELLPEPPFAITASAWSVTATA
jgi:SAM-dependent methyltransferase